MRTPNCSLSASIATIKPISALAAIGGGLIAAAPHLARLARSMEQVAEQVRELAREPEPASNGSFAATAVESVRAATSRVSRAVRPKRWWRLAA